MAPVEETVAETKSLFLVDALGALFTACMVGMVLPKFAYLIGMSERILLVLSIVALFFSVYSFGCYWRKTTDWRFLASIAAANIVYCIATLSIVAWQFEQLTLLGIGYFLGEATLIIILVVYECKAVLQLRK